MLLDSKPHMAPITSLYRMMRWIAILFYFFMSSGTQKKKQISKNVTETKTMIRIYLMGLIELLVYSTMNSVVVGRNLGGKIFFFFPVKGRGKNFLYIKIALTGVEELQPSVSLHNSRNSTLMVSSGTRARFIRIQKKMPRIHCISTVFAIQFKSK